MKYLYPATSLITTATGILTIITNQTSGIYDSTQDSIALPLITLAAILLALNATHILQLLIHNKKLKTRTGRYFLFGISGFLSTISFIILAVSTFYWWVPNHIIISLLYCMTTAVFIYNQIIFFRKS